MTKPVEAAIGLGGNVGDVASSFAVALERLSQAEGVEIVRVSSLWRTKPWGKTDQPDFLNAAALLRTKLPPRALLDLCLTVERSLGRQRDEKWGPRTIDLDILTYGDAIIQEPGLTIPHPRLAERAFALLPLAEIAPDMMLDRETIASRAARADSGSVTRA